MIHVKKKDVQYVLSYLTIEYMKEKPINIKNTRNLNQILFSTLIYLVGELNLIYSINKNNLSSFYAVMKKHQIEKEIVDLFLYDLVAYFNGDQSRLETIEKTFIDMFFMKFEKPTEKDYKEFEPYLIHSKMKVTVSNEIINSIESYLRKRKQYQILQNQSLVVRTKNNVLMPDLYGYMGYDLYDICQKSTKEVEKINKQIYNFFEVGLNDQDKIVKLKQEFSYYKKYGNKLTSGSGFADSFLIISMATTAFLILLIIISLI